MRQGVSEIEEEGTFVLTSYEGERLAREEVVRIVALVELHALVILPEVFGIVVVRVVLIKVAVKVVEALTAGHARRPRLSQAPLTNQPCAIARALQDFRDGHVFGLERHTLVVAPHVAADACVPLMQSRYEARTRGRADRARRVGVCKAHPFARHAVEVRRAYEALTVSTEVAAAEVVGHYEDNVRLALTPRLPRRLRAGSVRVRERGTRQQQRTQDCYTETPTLVHAESHLSLSPSVPV